MVPCFQRRRRSYCSISRGVLDPDRTETVLRVNDIEKKGRDEPFRPRIDQVARTQSTCRPNAGHVYQTEVEAGRHREDELVKTVVVAAETVGAAEATTVGTVVVVVGDTLRTGVVGRWIGLLEDLSSVL